MKGNRNDGIGLSTAESKLSSLWRDLKKTDPSLNESFWDREFQRIFKQMRKRAKMIREGGVK